jgi:hypothetical protein
MRKGTTVEELSGKLVNVPDTTDDTRHHETTSPPTPKMVVMNDTTFSVGSS